MSREELVKAILFGLIAAWVIASVTGCSPMRPTRYAVTYTVNVSAGGSAKVEAGGVDSFIASGFWTAAVETSEVPGLVVTPVVGCATWFMQMPGGAARGAFGCAR
jgi:hypothetical protein